MALQETAEVYLVSLFEDTNLAIIHAKCVTVTSTSISHSSHADYWLFLQPASRRTLPSPVSAMNFLRFPGFSFQFFTPWPFILLVMHLWRSIICTGIFLLMLILSEG